METADQKPRNRFDDLVSRLPLLWVSLAFLVGILLASLLHTPPIIWFVLAGVAAVLTILVRLFLPLLVIRPLRFSPSYIFLFMLSLLALFLGAARYQATIPDVDAHHIAWYSDREYEVLITGTLTDPPDERDTYTNLRLDVTDVDTGGETLPVSGLILARVQPGSDLHYGDVVRLRGHLKTPPANEDFSYRDYLSRQGILAYMPDAEATLLPFRGGNFFLRQMYAFKDHAVEHIYSLFPDPEASLLAGILLGNDNGLSADLQQAYKDTGTAHIIAISGFNIAIIAGLFVTVFSRLLGTRRGAVAAVLEIILYTVLVGASASVVRAAIMGSLAVFARQMGRRQTALNTLAFTAALMVAIFSPHLLWDVGFQLSFAATLGLILYAQPFQDGFARLLARRLPAETAQKIAALPVGEFVLFTLAAQLTTLPLMAYHFKRISLISVLANPFVLPVQPEVMVLGGLALLLSFIYLPLGKVFGWIAWPFAAYTNRAVEFFDRFPHGNLALGDLSLLFVLLFYAVLFFFTFAGPRLKQSTRSLLTPGIVAAALGLSAYLVWATAFARPDGRLHLIFLDVGSADAVLIETPSGRHILVNGGETPSLLAEGLGRRLPPFGRSLDWLVVASPQETQVGALPRIVERFPPQNVLWAGNVEASFSAGELDRWLASSGTPVVPAYPGASLDLGDGARLEILSVSERGAVLLLEWNGFRALLPMGLNFTVLSKLENGKDIGPVTVLLLADSGYGPSNPPEWLANLQPQVAILSVEAGDSNGLPANSVLDRLAGSTLLRTDQNGWIDISTDGLQLWLEVEKK